MMILCTGQEAVGAGVCAALAPEDAIITNHRSHSHLLSKGADPKLLMAEIFCKKTGYNKGKSGTLHLAVPEVNAPCTTTVVGGGPPIAVGRAFAQQYRKQRRVTVCFIGDGAANEGSFHEALNLASLWELPVIFVCENNLYAGAQRYEEETWRALCPIPRLRGDMLAEGLISAEELREMEADIEEVVKDAVRFAEESPYPDPQDALEDLFA